MGETYEGAGVSIDAGEQAVQRIKDKVRSTFRREVIGDIGGFGGLFALDTSKHRDPVLVASTDGVGTKALVAQAAGRFDTIGVDLVAMCVDDLVCQGAEPLFFLDYIAVGRLDPDHIEQLVHGVAEGCRQAGCALIGGEMAEHPGAMDPGEFDLVGFAVGVADRDRLLTGDHVEAGDVLLGLPSPGTISPISTARWPAARSRSRARKASRAGTTTTMPMPRLNTRAISSSLTSPRRWISSKIRGGSQARRRATASTPPGSTRTRFPCSPPPVMWATAWTSTSRSSFVIAGA